MTRSATARGLLLLVLTFGAGAGPARAEEPAWAAELPSTFRSDVDEPVVDAVQIWRLGDAYAPSARGVRAGSRPPHSAPLEGVDWQMGGFLRHPRLQSAVQFSDAVTATFDDRLAAALTAERPPGVQLVALAALVRVRAPRSVAAQWDTVARLRTSFDGDERALWLLGEIAHAFDEAAVTPLAAREPPAGRYDDDHEQQWALRVAGVCGHVSLLPRLRALSVCDNLGASLAAVQSLTELPGDAADEALDHAVRGWRYDAYVRAARALLARDPERLRRTLLEVEAPEACRYQQGLFLGRLGDPAAVPHLCATVGKTAMVDREMFDLIERLANREQLALVEALPDAVRATQRARAEAVAAAVHARLSAAGQSGKGD